jgi:hypothetical protein
VVSICNLLVPLWIIPVPLWLSQFHFGSSLFHFGYPSSTYDSKAGGNTVVMCINGGEHQLHCGTGPGTTWQSGVSPNQAWSVPRWKQDVAILHFLCFNLYKDVNNQWIEYVETFDKTIHHPMIVWTKTRTKIAKGLSATTIINEMQKRQNIIHFHVPVRS